MGYRKENKFAFDEGRKESFIQRLKQVIGVRSVRAAAKDWGLSFSTLNNYITRGTEPSFIAMQAIAHAEGISLDWLAFGTGDSNVHQDEVSAEADTPLKSAPKDEGRELLRTAWTTAFEFMGKTEAETLLRIIISGGARGLIKLAEHEATLEEAFMMLSPDLKERAMTLIDAHVDAKKGASEGSEVNSTQSPEQEAKRAG